MQQNDSSRDSRGYQIERTDVASIIAAARKNIKEKELNIMSIGKVDLDLGKIEQEGEGEVKDAKHSDDGSDDDDDSASGSENGSNNNSDHGNVKDRNSENDSNSNSGDESSDDEVDDVEKAKDMDQDVVRDRKAKTKKRSHNDDDSDNDNDDDDDDDESVDVDDEDAKREAAKAAKYFDSALLQQGNQVSEFEKMDVFAQLNLSRPLLRGVASIGFVTPTPIQSRVIPLALSGRDVCAR